MFRIGQKVVCVNAANRHAGKIIRGYRVTADLNGLTEGAVYTVRGFGTAWTDGSSTILLGELHRPPFLGVEQGYVVSRFRPVVEKSTDAGMAILKEILERETIKDAVPVGNMTVKDVMALHDRTMAQLRAWVGR